MTPSIRLRFRVAGAALAAAAWFAAGPAFAQIEIKLGHVGEPGSLFQQSSDEFAKRANAKLAGKAQWVQSYVVDDKTFCISLAESEAAVKEHARLSGFPASKVTEVRAVIDPMTAI